MIHRASISLLAASCFCLVAAGCHSDGLYDPCPLSNSIVEACGKTANEGHSCDTAEDCEGGLTCVDGACFDGTAYSCVVAEHPFCLEEICASWQGAPAVCTRACVIDDDCPGTGSCVSHQDLSFCVDGVTSEAPGVFRRMNQAAEERVGTEGG